MKIQYKSIDIAKFIASLLVIAIHSKPLNGLGYEIIINVIARCAVPFFFIIGSFFFFSKSPDKKTLKKYIIRIAKLYVIWFVIDIPLTYVNRFHNDQYFVENIYKLIRSFFISSTFSGSWYLTASIEGTILVYLLSKRLNNILIFLFCFILYILSVMFTFYSSFLPNDIVLWIYKHLGLLSNTFFSSSIFIILGKIIADNKETSFHRKNIISIGLVVSFSLALSEVIFTIPYRKTIFASTDSYLSLIPLGFFIALWILSHEIVSKKSYLKLRNYSTIFYFIHFSFVWIFFFINKHYFNIDPIIIYLSTVVCCTVFAEFIINVSRIPKFTWLKYSF
ncbi:MAG: acyltransferase family protein [Bacteroidaceae bacterium]|jgi:serine/alanine racemase|nr:acyltransferase family protein [Bacteroidaceae bacterium]